MRAHIYFDLDGTLTDPYEGITRCILYALDELGFPHPDDDYLYSCIGPPLWDTFPELVGEELTRKAVDLYRERFVDVGWKENVPYEGIHEALETIASAGHALFVATAKPHMHAARIVEHFGMGEFFHNVYGSELDGTRATKTELLRFAIDKNPGDVERVMIGDRRHDLLGAVANDMRPIGVAWGYGSVDELTDAGARSIALAPNELPGILTIPSGFPGPLMKPATAESALKVQAALGAGFEVLEFDASTRTAADAAEAVGCTVAQIAKSLLFMAAESKRPVLVIASGSKRVDEAKVSTLLGEQIARADANFVRERTGFAIGGVPPLAHRVQPVVFIDDTLLGFETIWAAAGTPNAVFRLTPDDLVRLSGGAVADVAA